MRSRCSAMYILATTAALLGASARAADTVSCWQTVTCPTCEYSIELPTFGHLLEGQLEPNGGRVQNYREGPEAFKDGSYILRKDCYWLEVSMYPNTDVPFLPLGELCADNPTPLGPDGRGFWCRISRNLDTEWTATHVARMPARDKVLELVLDASALDADDARRIIESLRVRPAEGK